MLENVSIVKSYFDAIGKGDFETVGNLFVDDIVWHQPGKGVQSGTYHGKDEIFVHLGNFMKWSEGSFAIDNIVYIADNGDLVNAVVHFKAEKGDKKISMNGVDLLRIENNKIKEIWLFSEKIEDEDAFWNDVSSK